MAGDFNARLKSIMGEYWRADGRLVVNYDTVPEAKAHMASLKLMQKELRLFRREISSEKREVNSQYVEAKAKTGSGAGGLVMGALLGRGKAGKINKFSRDSLRSQQRNAVAPYEEAERILDGVLVGVEKIRLSLEQYIAANKV